MPNPPDWRNVVARLRAGTHILDDFWLNPLPLAVDAAALIEAQVGEIKRLRIALTQAVAQMEDDGRELTAGLSGLPERYAVTFARAALSAKPEGEDVQRHMATREGP
jgi:hypothetical protein